MNIKLANPGIKKYALIVKILTNKIVLTIGP
jgi:hypothetical protein